MKSRGNIKYNLLLMLGSVALTLLLALGADRVFGALRTPPQLPETLELIFPPHAEQHYATSDFTYTAYVNGIGIRDRELPRERGDAFRIVAIGDSYTYGWGVNIEDTWVRRLDNAMKESGKKVEVINLGKPGVGPPFYAELAEKAIPILRPDLVLVCLLQGNDIRAAGPETVAEASRSFWDAVRALFPNFTLYMRDLRREREYTGRSHEAMPPQVSTAEDNRRWTANTAREFYEKMTPEHRARFDAFDEEVRTAYLNGDLNPYMVDLALQNPDFYILTMDLEDSWTETCVNRAAALLARIGETAQEYGCKAAVIAMPEGPYVNRSALTNMSRVGYNMPEWLLTTSSMDDTIERAAQRAGLPFYKVTDAFRARRDEPDLYFELDGHPTPKGHQIFAEAFLPVLRQIIGP